MGKQRFQLCVCVCVSVCVCMYACVYVCVLVGVLSNNSSCQNSCVSERRMYTRKTLATAGTNACSENPIYWWMCMVEHHLTIQTGSHVSRLLWFKNSYFRISVTKTKLLIELSVIVLFTRKISTFIDLRLCHIKNAN